MTQRLVYVEFDQPYCANTFGSAPCTATGSPKCYNSRLTCQDRPNYVDAPVTLRFSVDCDYLPANIEAIPSILQWSVSPGIISIGEDLGLRAEMRVTLRDHPWPDTGPGGDKYLVDRVGDPFGKGTFWGKWRARVRYMRGRPMRLIIGDVGQSIDQMETRHFIVENVDGPDREGNVTIIGKDPLKLADGDRAQAPALSRGYLQAAITETDTTATLAPAGVGAEYPTSGFVAIAGAEICAFVRFGDTLTLTRAQLGTEAKAHEPEDRVQVVLRYVGQDPALIIADLLQTYAGIPSDYIPIDDWTNETAAYSGRVFSSDIAEPTDVSRLISELIQQAGLSVWWDEVNRKVRLRVLRQIPTDAATFDDETILAGTFRSQEQPAKRVSQVWVWYGQRNPLKKIDDQDNYRSVVAEIETDAETDYGSPAIKKIYSRWIAAFGRQSAQRTCDLHIGRYRDAPRRFNFSLFRDQADIVQAGQGYKIAFWPLQNADGQVEGVPIQITRFEPGAAEVTIEAEEATFTRLDPVDLQNRTITIDVNTLNFNLRNAHDLIYPAPVSGDDFTLTVLIQSGVIVGGTVLGQPAFDVGTWTGFADVVISVENNGRIQGRGGKGGNGWGKGASDTAEAGEAGSPALKVSRAISFVNNGSILGGGGGGGGGGRSAFSSDRQGGGGGGGQGFQAGAGGSAITDRDLAEPGTPGTTELAGEGGIGVNRNGSNSGGDGGTAGQAGSPGTPTSGGGAGGSGGAAGAAIDGVSFITMTNNGSIIGAQVG
jgi:hypothetical protein